MADRWFSPPMQGDSEITFHLERILYMIRQDAVVKVRMLNKAADYEIAFSGDVDAAINLMFEIARVTPEWIDVASVNARVNPRLLVNVHRVANKVIFDFGNHQLQAEPDQPDGAKAMFKAFLEKLPKHSK